MARLCAKLLIAIVLCMPQFVLATSENGLSSAADATGAAADAPSLPAAGWPPAAGDASRGIPISGLSFPVDTFPDGTTRARFNAEKAFLPEDEDDFVRADDVLIELYDEDSSILGYFIAEKCVYDKSTCVGYCEGAVRIEYRAPERTIRIDGTNMQWNVGARNVKILTSPKVTMSEIMRGLGDSFK